MSRDGDVTELEVGQFRCRLCGVVTAEHDKDGMTECPACVESDESSEFEELKSCPYYARFFKLARFDPDGECSFGCVDEPVCVNQGGDRA